MWCSFFLTLLLQRFKNIKSILNYGCCDSVLQKPTNSLEIAQARVVIFNINYRDSHNCNAESNLLPAPSFFLQGLLVALTG